MFPAKKEAEHLRDVKEIDAAILKLELELKKIRDHEIDNLEKAAEYRDAFSKKLAGKLAYAEGKRRRAGARREDSSDFVDVGGITKEMTDSYDDFKTYIENPVLDGISNISMAWESQFHQNLLATFNDGKTVADQFFIGIAEGFNRILTDLATKGIMSLILSLLPGFNLASAWSFVGGKAGGGWVKPGQYAMVGENGPEMAYATAGGTYVYNNQKTIKQFEGTGGGVQVIPIIRADELSVMVKYGSQMRSGRRF
jgi:hypothetical protein